MHGKGRNCPFDRKILEGALEELVNSFKLDWLTSDTGHPIQRLWKRDDYLASIELSNLGCSIKKARRIDSGCTAKHIDLIKSAEPNTRRGSLYEIIFAAAFNDPPEQEVKLLHPQAPTYDLEVRLKDTSIINISVKNFGNSKNDELFKKESKDIEAIAKKFISRPMQIFISNDVYPSTRDWDNLKRWLPKILKFPIDAKNNVDRWRISLIPLIPAGKKFYPNRASYTFFITVHFHHREESRLNKSLIKACLDIEENGDKETDKIINMLCIHIPAYVSLENYANWCRNYLRAIPESQISGMRLIQPVLAVDTSRDKSFLAFSYRDIIKPERLKNWFKANNRRLNGEFVVGVPTTKPIDIIFNPSGYDLARRHYIYQSGNIYYLYDELTDGSMKGNVRFDYGVHTHAVMRLFREDTIWSGKFPPNDELLIL